MTKMHCRQSEGRTICDKRDKAHTWNLLTSSKSDPSKELISSIGLKLFHVPLERPNPRHYQRPRYIG